MFLGFQLEVSGESKPFFVSLDDETSGGSRNSGIRLLKGEAVDISLPDHKDINLQMWTQGERDAPGSFAREARLRCGGGLHVDVRCESLGALILEQRDLTFGARVRGPLEVWRVAKSAKRLRRLVVPPYLLRGGLPSRKLTRAGRSNSVALKCSQWRPSHGIKNVKSFEAFRISCRGSRFASALRSAASLASPGTRVCFYCFV